VARQWAALHLRPYLLQKGPGVGRPGAV